MTEVLSLAGRKFLFDYGEIAKFLLRFTDDGFVEVANIVGLGYSIRTSDIFPVKTEDEAVGAYRIVWSNPSDQTRLEHMADFAKGLTSVTIDDAIRRETRRFSGTITGG